MPLQSAASAGRDAEDDPYLGQEISGHIEIRQLVGIGAMGRVYRAFQKGIDRDVAVKILHRELSANAQLVSRFTREAKVASRLQHPNVVQVLLAGQLPDRALYMVMEYLEGLSLQSALAAAGGALPLPKALHIALQLCEASGEAHAVGIVHRDLKPENVMLVRRGTDPDFVKVLDFGIARINWGEQSVATAAGLIFGTARYISPEGAQGNAVGPPSDVYSIATLLYQMLSGRTPFEGDQAVGLLVQQIHDAPPHLKSIPRAEYVPNPLADVIMANLAKDPKRREPDARMLGHAIIDAAKQSGLAAEDISRPMLRRHAGAMQLPPTERTKQLDLSPELADRLSPPPTRVSDSDPDVHVVNGDGRYLDARAAARSSNERTPMGATAKWEPPTEFQARLADAVGRSTRSERPSGVVPSAPSSRPMAVVPTPAPSRPRSPSGVDETIDDALADPPAPQPPSTLATPPPPRFPSTSTEARRPPSKPPPRVAVAEPSRPRAEQSVPRTMPGDVDDGPSTAYTPPLPQESSPQVARSAQPPQPLSEPPPSQPRAPTDQVEEPRKSRGLLFVVLCFVLGMAIAAGWAWKVGKIGGSDGDDERYVARATDAMYKNRFVTPPGDNVRDITDEGLKKWPNDHRLLDIRMRAANELVTQAMTQRSAGDIMEALRLARNAHDLDPNDGSAKRLVDQYENELASFTTPAATPLGKPPPSGAVPGGKPGVAPTPPVGPAAPAASATAYKVILDANAPQPRLGQTVEFTARVAPPKGPFDAPIFTISGPGLGGGVTMQAQSPSPGVFKASYSFMEAGRFDVVFSAQSEGKALRAGRSLNAGEPPAPKPPPAAPDPGPKPPATAPTGSVKWM
jgi:serine/threonine-protein kinase